MAILNYTTKVPVERTVAEIQRILASHGAKSIQTDYANGAAVGVAFFIETTFGERAYVLPANIDGVWQTIVQQNRQRRIAQRLVTKQQAARIAWRIVKDWIEAQMAIVEAGMATVDQVMLPYMQVGNESLYEALKSSKLALPAGRGDQVATAEQTG